MSTRLRLLSLSSAFVTLFSFTNAFTHAHRETLIQGGTIISIEEKTSKIVPVVGSLLIQNGSIIQIEMDIPVTENMDVVDAHGTVVSPGFIDTIATIG
ncbi:hypothetical protein K469DRAFT_807728 [Zopfia rhizophila CBS 207.26]|uniref:Amidohydrolase n=1 Tax=Zopfia rhizophila CBS 207.26 TaxID=1314779 RepID=A0A6A6DD75_9PEZI|nr:hypothetical protein K469DRAFT_807728 [Zopfia rhizophila CBS 207.26]